MRWSDRQVLVTGAAGFLGGHLVFRLLEAGDRVTALARPTAGLSAAERLAQVADRLGRRWPQPRLSVVEADLEEPGWGLGGGEAEKVVRRAPEVVHAAARVDLSPRRPEAVMAANAESLDGWLPLLAAADATFNLVSTAYVAGAGVAVALDRGPGERVPGTRRAVRNPYEESKARAEEWVLRELPRRGVRYRILRPAIVVGEHGTGRTLSFHTVYTLLQLLDGLRRSAAGSGEPVPLRIACDPAASLSLVPVDYVSEATRVLLSRPATVGGVYHLAPPEPVGLTELSGWLGRAFAPLAPEPVEPSRFTAEPAGRLEALVDRALAVYRPYLACRTRFDDTATRRALAGSGVSCPRWDEGWLGRLLDYGRETGWGRLGTAPCGRAAKLASGSDSRGSVLASRPEPPGTGVAGSPRSLAAVSDRDPADFAQAFFDRFLAGWLGEPLVPGASSTSVRFDVVLTDLDGWCRRVAVEAGRLVSVAPPGGMPADCRYELESAVLRRIASGGLDPREAFFTRRTDIRGDVEAGLQVASLMIDFFRRNPFAGLGTVPTEEPAWAASP